MRLFGEYEWPGNVRELENLLKRAVVLGSDESIRRELAENIAGRTPVPGPIPALQSRAEADVAVRAGGDRRAPRAWRCRPRSRDRSRTSRRHAAREAERELIYRTLQQTRWNRREAAEILGVSYKALLYKIKEAELDKAS